MFCDWRAVAEHDPPGSDAIQAWLCCLHRNALLNDSSGRLLKLSSTAHPWYSLLQKATTELLPWLLRTDCILLEVHYTPRVSFSLPYLQGSESQDIL